MSEIEVRRGKLGDLDRIVAFNLALARESEGLELDPDIVRAGVRAQLEDSARGSYFLAEDAGEAVGQLAVTTEWSDWRNGFFWWIQSVYTRPPARRRGVLRALYRHVERAAREDPGCRGLRLYVENENAGAIGAYRALGLREAPYRMLEVDFTEPARNQG